MIQDTVSRLIPISGSENITIISGQAHISELEKQLPEISANQIIAEPMPRGSGPAIGLATAIAYNRDPDAIVGSFAADHIITDTTAFEAAVRSAMAVARQGYLVTIGIEPAYPETGYGYISAGKWLGNFAGLHVYDVERFKEKPDLESAREYVASGTYLWNAGMFVWRAGTLMEEMRRFLPSLAYALERVAASWDLPSRYTELSEIWPSVEDISIDHGIMERSERVAVVPGSFGWSDVGDWHGFGTVAGGGTDETVVLNAEQLISRDVERSVIMGNGRMIALLGLEDLVIVDTPDALLVCHRSRAQEVKHLVEELKRRGVTNLV